MKYVYPAIFTKEEVGYSVRFPDVSGCFTQGEDLPEAIGMAEDALCLMLYEMEKRKESAPKASDIKDVGVEEGEFVNLIACDTDEYRRYFDSKAVKKTLTIPAWLNHEAEEQGINFSQVLQEALKKQLHM